MLEGLVGDVRRSGKKTILEGIETRDDLPYAQRFGIDFVQCFFSVKAS